MNKEEETALTIGALALYGGIKAPAGAISKARKGGAGNGLNDGHYCPGLYYNWYFIGEEIGLISIII